MIMRMVRGLGALLVLVAGLVGVPALLVILIGNPLPSSLDWSELAAALSRPDDGSILVGLVALVAWVAWLVFAVSVVVELVAVLSQRRIQLRLPGLGGPQRLASGLVLAVVALTMVNPRISLATPPSTPAVVPPQIAGQQVVPASTVHVAESRPAEQAGPQDETERGVDSDRTPSKQRASSYVVQRGDDLWSLAQRFYGEGQRWRTIAAANPELLTGGPDRLQPGWKLTIPEDGPARSGSGPSTTYVVTERGDTLTSIAARVLGDDSRWRVLFEANRFQLDDPDELPVGVRLLVPATDRSDEGSTRTRDAHRSDTGRTSSDRDSSASAPATRDSDAESGAAHAPSPEDRRTAGTSPTTAGRPEAAQTAPEQPGQESSGRPAGPHSGQAGPAAGEQPSAAGPADSRPPTEDPARSQPPLRQQTESSPASGGSVFHSIDPLVAGIAGVGGLLAAAVVAGAAHRRRVQLQARPIGRRIPRPTPAAQLAESHLGRRQRPLGLRTLDLATRAIAAHSHDTGTPLPELALATVSDERLVLEMTEPDLSGPEGFRIEGCAWQLDALDVDLLRSTPGLSDAVRPYPALVTLGTTDDEIQVVADLESLGLTSVETTDPDLASRVLAAMAVELACSPWAEELELILVDTCEGLPDALGRHSVTRVDDLTTTLERLGRRAAAQRRQLPGQPVAARRVDPDLADPWVPTIVIIDRPLTTAEERLLRQLVLTEPPVSIAAVGLDLVDAPCRLTVSGTPGTPTARLWPYDVSFVPQLLTPPTVDAVVDLLETTGRTDTAPAPWWFDDADSTEPDPDPPDNVTYLGRRFGGWVRSAGGGDADDHRPDDPHDHHPDDLDQEGAAMEQLAAAAADHPVLRLLGPVTLEGAAGVAPTRAAKQCLEYCAWLLEYPGTTAQAMATALGVAEGTRRSNMSRLRAWLGSDEVDRPYLPDAYSGRILLHPSVSSDWQRLQILTSRGVNRTSTSGLEAALRLVRGAPLADAAPGQWHWAEGLRTDMVSVIRDLGVELAERALGDSDTELARWAATRALLVAPGDELLLVARIKTEHRAGNYPEVERLTLQLAAHARTLEVDLRPETVDVLQEMMEGRVRARLA